jgi:hypothetical protein
LFDGGDLGGCRPPELGEEGPAAAAQLHISDKVVLLWFFPIFLISIPILVIVLNE